MGQVKQWYVDELKIPVDFLKQLLNITKKKIINGSSIVEEMKGEKEEEPVNGSFWYTDPFFNSLSYVHSKEFQRAQEIRRQRW